MRRLYSLILLLLFCISSIRAVDVEVWVINNQDKILKIEEKNSGKSVDPGELSGFIYNVSLDPGVYEFSMYASDGTTFIGAYDVTIEDVEKHNPLMFYYGTFIVNNQHPDGSVWVEGEDYTISIDVETQKGEKCKFRSGRDTQGRLSVLLRGSDHMVGTTTPSQKNIDEGYMAYSARRAVTNNSSLDLTMPKGVVATVTLPVDASIQVGTKSSHFVDFSLIQPSEEKIDGDKKILSYTVLPNKTINYRTWKEGRLTRAGYFSSPKDDTSTVDIVFTDADYDAFDPKAYNHDVRANSGYETGDILVNGNERGHISLSVGEVFNAHAMRSWQLTDTSVNNYFMEPDFHYTVLGIDGKPLEGVIEIVSSPGSAWADIKALAPGTAIVLVTYDAIGVNYYSNGTRNSYMGGEIWGAIWPENTAAYVVTVDQPESSVKPNMLVNEEYNTGTLKVAGENVDAEHDVFYYLDSEEGFSYTFTPEDVAEISIAYPRIGEHMATYNGFSTDGARHNEDGSWTLQLREGRQIIRMVDDAGNSAYQVMRARKCKREIINASRPGSKIYQPGDKVKIQYSGLFHPANKLAGIYNMSAYVTYNGIPNGTSLILGANQYTFGSAPAAQAVTLEIPEDFDIEANPVISLSDGLLQVSGYGDPIGNHRLIDRNKGRDANFAAKAHKTYFGSIPDMEFTVSPYQSFKIQIESNVEAGDITVKFNGTELTSDAQGFYTGTYGTYDVAAKKDGYYCFRQSYIIEDDASGVQTFRLEMEKAPQGAWDGVSMSRPETVGDAYHIMNGAELAWFANEVNTNDNASNAELGTDIELAGHEWTPIGQSSHTFNGKFNGNGYTIKGLYIDKPASTYQGLFGFIAGEALVTSLILEGEVIGGDYSGTIVGQAKENAVVDRCANYADISAKRYGGGIVGYLFTGSKLTNSYNAGSVYSTTNGAGIAGMIFSASVENVYNIGEVVCDKNAGALTGRFTGSTVANVFVNREYDLKDEYIVVSNDMFASGEIAHRLGEAFGQIIGEEPYPVINGARVYKVEYTVMDNDNSDEVLSLSDDDASVFYTNGVLPSELNGEKVSWYEDAEKTRPISAVNSDASLFAVRDIETGIDEIVAVDIQNARWFNIQGMEISEPAPGVHGIFIRVINGKSEKILL